MNKLETIQLTEIRKDITYLTEMVKEGFSEIHKRQDKANGKLSNHDEEITKIKMLSNSFLTKLEFSNKFGNDKIDSLNQSLTWKDKLFFVIFTTGLTAFVTICTNLIINQIK